MRIALEEWHRRIPDYGLADDETILEHGGQFGLERLPLAWEPPDTPHPPEWHVLRE